MKALTKAKTLRSILAEKLTKKDGWQITPVRHESGTYSVKCWHKFELRKKIGTLDLVHSCELNDIVGACDLFGASYYAHIPYGCEGVVEFAISLTEFYTDKEIAEREAKEQEGAE